MFNTDRVSLDPHFNREQSTKRYFGIIEDRLRQGAEIYFLIKDDKKIGFFLIQQDNDKIWNGMLSGLFPSYQGKGLGSNVVTQMLRCVADKKERYFISHVSTNNRISFELHLKRGFQTADVEYLFVKHNSSQ